MATQGKNDLHNVFLVMNQAAVDLANHTAVLSVDTAIDVEMLDGIDQFPLDATSDIVLSVNFPITLEAGIVLQGAYITDTNTITIRTTNPSAGAVNPASIAAGAIKFAIGRR